MSHPVLALDDDVGEREAVRDIPLLDPDRLEHRRRRLVVVQRRGLAIVDLHVRREQRLAIFVSQQQNRFREMANRPLGEARLVVLDQRDDVAAGDISEVHDREASGVEIETDRCDLAGRDGRPDGARVQEVGEREIVDVVRGAGDL